jgi:Phytoene/squalene synthetase
VACERHALKALYYFCREVDDSIDEAPSKSEARKNLEFWRGEIENIYVTQQPPKTETARLLGIAIWQYQLPRQPFEDLLNGMEFDCGGVVEIETEAELEKYCFCVAGTVGLQAMRIFGVQGEQADEFAIQLGQALQLTNIFRDWRKDGQVNRFYIPGEWGKEGLSKLILKAEDSFTKVAELEKSLPSRKLLPALLMRDIYQWKLNRLKRKKASKPLSLGIYFSLLGNGTRYYAKSS